MKGANQFKTFSHPQFGEMGIIQFDDGRVLFKANYVAKPLRYSSPQNVVTKRCKGGTVLILPSESQFGAVVLKNNKTQLTKL